MDKAYSKRYESQFLQKVLLQLTRGSKWYRKIKLNENVIRFVASIRKESRLFNVNELNEYHHNIIQDKSNFRKTAVSEEQYLKSQGKHLIEKKSAFVSVFPYIART